MSETKNTTSLLRLSSNANPRTVLLTNGVQLLMRQPGQFEYDIASNAAKAAARRLSSSAEELSEYGLQNLASTPTELLTILSADEDGLISYGKHLLAVELGMLQIDKVNGVTGLDGKPMSRPTKPDLSALFQTFIPNLNGISFGGYFLHLCEAGAELEFSEGNVSAVAPSGSSVAAANIANNATSQVNPARKVGSARPKKKDKRA